MKSPISGSSRLRQQPKGNRVRREVAVIRVQKLLGWEQGQRVSLGRTENGLPVPGARLLDNLEDPDLEKGLKAGCTKKIYVE